MNLERLNYHHLHHFWVVAREGSITAAARKLRLSHPTLSAQIRELEEALGVPLFDRRGRGLVLTETGRVARRYADEIFTLGTELVDTVRGRAGSVLHLRVGVLDILPKSIVHRLVSPALALEREVQLVIREDRSLEGFLAEMATHELDLVLSDRPAGANLSVRLYDHPLGRSELLLVSLPAQADGLRAGFPTSLDRAPAVLPSPASPVRRGLDAAFARLGVRPRIVAEVDDSALAKVLAADGLGFCAVPRILEEEVRRRYELATIAPVDVEQQYYGIVSDRRANHAGVEAILGATLAGGPPATSV